MKLKDRFSRTEVLAPHDDEVLTEQHMADSTDINLIVKNYASSGMWDHVNPREPMYGDFTAARELNDAFLLVEQANSDFEELPSAVRKVAGNNPATLLSMLGSPEGCYELQEAGMPFKEPIAPPPQPSDDAAPAKQELAQSGTSLTAPSATEAASGARAPGPGASDGGAG